MGLICKIRGHSWQSGRCVRCGEPHMEHQWTQRAEAADKHAYFCNVCGAKMTTPHEWNGCV